MASETRSLSLPHDEPRPSWARDVVWAPVWLGAQRPEFRLVGPYGRPDNTPEAIGFSFLVRIEPIGFM